MISNAGFSGELYCPSCERQFSSGDRCPHDGTKLVRLATTVDPFLGKELEGRYTITEKLGQGGMGAVYRGSQHSVGRDVAIKVVTPALVSNPEVIKRFLRECKLSSRLSHPNAVGVLDFGQTSDGIFFLVMELVQGRTLDDVIESEKKLRPERVIRIGIQVCDALEGAHELKIIHRDLKPSNVMLMSSGRDLVKVLDFGLAKSLAPDSTQSTMTNAGVLMGTPAFMPPELATGQECDGRADLYSLGCMLYYMGSGRLPFYSDSIHELVAMHASDPAPPMQGVPRALATVIDRMLLKNPNDRYQTASQNREALEEALLGLRDSQPIAVQSKPVDDTKISIGPFPAESSQFEFLKSEPAVRPAIPRAPTGGSGRNRKPANTAETRAAMSETYLGDEAVLALDDTNEHRRVSKTSEPAVGDMPRLAAAALTSAVVQGDVPAPKKSKGLLYGGVAAAVVAVAVVVGVKMSGGGASKKTDEKTDGVSAQGSQRAAATMPDAAPAVPDASLVGAGSGLGSGSDVAVTSDGSGAGSSTEGVGAGSDRTIKSNGGTGTKPNGTGTKPNGTGTKPNGTGPKPNGTGTGTKPNGTGTGTKPNGTGTGTGTKPSGNEIPF
ncbi:MAG TPA: serine/threonine-protein kinase [Kofleriaceae bacterium]|nr:serine/threonine-protein kinase [Kofleriaceae bacterium]